MNDTEKAGSSLTGKKKWHHTPVLQVHGDDDPTKRRKKSAEEIAEQKSLFPGQRRPNAPPELRVWG
ncbi:MAG: hypothetical protein WC631_03735 [Candidatus Paceibacterota bacterium]|jgi:hypothetical protein